jgi:hypothetical protein
MPLILGVLLLCKMRRSWAGLGNLSMGFLMGVGIALALSGALLGTIGPQVQNTFASLNPVDYPETGWFGVLDAVIVVIGTIGTLFYFRFSMGRTGKRSRLGSAWSKVGRWTLMIAFGAIFASLVMSRVSLFVGRMQFLLGDWLHIIKTP